MSRKLTEGFASLSQGTRDMFLILLMAHIWSPCPLIEIEEPENGVHPSLQRNLLLKFNKICDDNGTKFLITSHSPSVIRHFDDDKAYTSLYIGKPSEDASATFATLRSDTSTKESIDAEVDGMPSSIGELIFDLMSGTEEDAALLKGWLNG
jgi:predicted ATPase